MTLTQTLQPQRVIDDLAQLATLTGDEHGAQRVAWTPTWKLARSWLCDRLAQLPLDVETDRAGNLWANLRGDSADGILLGSHLDSVPAGGALDGALGVLAALEIVRALAALPEPPRLSVKLVDWADEEGVRFGHSLLGSSAAAGLLTPAELAPLHDAQGRPLAAVLAEYGADLSAPATTQLDGVRAALELHIEQGPVLEQANLAAGVPSGTLAVERRLLVLTGVSAHAGSTPTQLRHDPLVVAARVIGVARELALAIPGARATTGWLQTLPGIPTAIAHTVQLSVDLRAPQDDALRYFVEGVEHALETAAEDEGVGYRWEPLWSIPAVAFDEQLVALLNSCLPNAPTLFSSGALHDSASLARRAIPAAMLFIRSRDGISHNPLEHSSDEDIIAGVTTMATAVERLLAR